MKVMEYMNLAFKSGYGFGQSRGRRGFIEAILALIMVVIFALVGYALLPTISNAAEAAALNGNVTVAGSATTRLGPMMIAVAILLAIVGAAFGIMNVFRR